MTPAVRAVVKRAVRGPGVTHDVIASAGAVGIAVSADRYDCVMARILDGRSGQVEVWRPARVYLQPGELGCGADAAAAGGGQRSPH
ncbi:hypothetical protein [Actinomadura alba]|uniref:Uncharacterized protein n=1 Tax=Actinomadura alba TaxID=406431 RepID=A0ABR7LTG1_9ACTN|nr:hypothetical protein [Actinomadura alba]MBC6467755.1 hypothetical protein [Actinomadura alba]